MSGKTTIRSGMAAPSTARLDAPGRDAAALQFPLDTQTSREPSFDAALRGALTDHRISDARTLVANAEAILAGHGATTATSLNRADLSAAKARIAIATGDSAAARAILVQAIEASPDAAALRSLMTEVMMATGRATDVRPVLQHLGNSQKDAASTPSFEQESTTLGD